MNKEQTDRQQILSLPDVTSADTGAGIYAWIFPDYYKDGLIPLYIGQSTNLWRRVKTHQQGLRNIYKDGSKFDPLYHTIRWAGLALVGMGDEIPENHFKLLQPMPNATKKELLSNELFYILFYGTNIYGFNSPLPLELYHTLVAPDSASEADVEFFKHYVEMLEQCHAAMGEDTKYLERRKAYVKSHGVDRGHKLLNDIIK